MEGSLNLPVYLIFPVTLQLFQIKKLKKYETKKKEVNYNWPNTPITGETEGIGLGIWGWYLQK